MANWKFSFEAPKGERIYWGFVGITTSYGFWWLNNDKIWVNDQDMQTHVKSRKFTGASTHAPCHSFKAFKRHLRKHPETKCEKVVLVSRWAGHNVSATWIENTQGEENEKYPA